MKIVSLMELPYANFGEHPQRQVRIAFSKEISDSPLSIVFCVVPPFGISEGHVHSENDEYIYFSSAGRVRIGGECFDIPAHTVVLAHRGEWHECQNTSDKELRLFCIYTPSLTPYGKYPALISETIRFFNEKKESKT